jgi:putative SOS response-associated peptidase YedK
VADDDPKAWTLTTTMLTADAVHTLDHIHDRNPVPLPPELWAEWLDPRVEGTQDFVDRAVAAAVAVAERLEIVKVSAVTDEAPGEVLA